MILVMNDHLCNFYDNTVLYGLGTLYLLCFLKKFQNIKKLKYLAVIFFMLKVYRFVTFKYYKTVQPLVIA